MEFEAWKLITAALALGGSWGGAKVALNGTRERVKEINRKFEQHVADEQAQDLRIHERMASVEAKIDVLIERTK
jgi:hypothetical protein